MLLRYGFASALFLLAVVATQGGLKWYWSVWIILAIFVIVVGRRRIFQPGVVRTTDSIACRYVPWYEGNNYLLCLLLPLLGAAMVAAGRDPVNPVWLQYGGIILLCLTPLFLFSIVNMWQRCVLRISPSVLTIRLGTPGSKLTEIRRDQIASITPMIVTTGPNRSLQTEIVYRPVNADSGNSETETALLGLQLTVKPVNLANALIAWDDAAIDDPNELLDLIERILRSKSVSDVTPPPSRAALEGQRNSLEDGSGDPPDRETIADGE